MLMSNINELAVSSRTVQSKIIESNGNMTFRLQDKEVTENGNVTADVGYDALSKVNVNVQGGGGSGSMAYAWSQCDIEGHIWDDPFTLFTNFDVAPEINAEGNYRVAVRYDSTVDITPFNHSDGNYIKVSDNLYYNVGGKEDEYYTRNPIMDTYLGTIVNW